LKLLEDKHLKIFRIGNKVSKINPATLRYS
jgi:hypothetical protein